MIARSVLLFVSLTAASAAIAQQPSNAPGSLVGRFLDAAGLRAPPPPTPDFVRESRPQRFDYMPIDPTRGPTGRKTAAEMRALGASLDAAIASNRAKAARVKAPDAAPQKRAR
jgi:hypothetical protein